jgi:COMPASS component BRE2
VAEEDHQPAVSSPLNPDVAKALKDDAPAARERAARSKKESLKKRESKGGALASELNSRATPDPKTKTANKQKAVTGTTTPLLALAPQRYILPQPKPTDFEPPRGATLIPARTFKGLDGSEIQFYTISDQYVPIDVSKAELTNIAFITKKISVILTVLLILHLKHLSTTAKQTLNRMGRDLALKMLQRISV